MSNLQVYKASAGAGKTFRLAIEYLKVALQSTYAYKNILGVTFTNKATSEMKGRVIAELFHLSKGENTPYMEILLDEMKPKLLPEQIQARAQECLRRLLHDYSRFSISTIDSFFQRVIKSFNKELNINGNFQLELDSDRALDEAIDQVLLSMDNNEELYRWVKQFADEKMEGGKSWSIKSDIKRLATEILTDDFRAEADELFERTQSKDALNNYTKSLQEVESNYFKHINQIGQKALKALSEAGLDGSEFVWKTTGPVMKFFKMANEAFTADEKRMRKAAEDPEKLTNKSSPQAAKDLAPQLSLFFQEYFNYMDLHGEQRASVRLVLDNIYSLGILIHIQQKLQELSQANSISLLAESGKLLQQIIDNSDTPFIYERMGTYYKHFLIDEFQDTSVLQWDNFRPLLSNSLAEGNLALIVGDVKQAIYRWRGGDWQLLENQVNKDFAAEGVSTHQLEHNWRSSGEIIRFNNRIFQLAPVLLQKLFSQMLEESQIDPKQTNYQQIRNVYSHATQLVGQQKLATNGYVHMRFIPTKNSRDGLKEERQNRVLHEMLSHIKDLQNRGAKASDISILVRKKKEAVLVSNFLLKQKNLLPLDSPYKLSILSSDSLVVSNSPAVCFLVSLLQLIDNHRNRVVASYANHQFYGAIYPSLQEQGMVISWSKLNNWKNKADDWQPEQPADLTYLEDTDATSNPFYAFLESHFMRKELGARNLLEMVFKLAGFFHLFELRQELAYLQAFIDSVSEFQRGRISDLSSFLAHWEEKGKQKSISTAETLDAIRIQTVHKSKGLEYPFVLIPFCDWTLSSESHFQNPIVWCKPREAPLNALNIVPIQYSTAMRDSSFKEEYFCEMQNMHIESLNMLYVAFTRARTELYTWSVYDEKKQQMRTIGDLLQHCIDQSEQYSLEGKEELCSAIHQSYHAEEELLQIGKRAFCLPEENKKKTHQSLAIHRFSFCDFDQFLLLRKNQENFFTQENDWEQRVNKGKIIHEVLAKINTKDELARALQNLQQKGLFPAEEMKSYSQQITAMIDDPEVASWFDGSYRVLNERSLLLGKEQGMRRPDRIMTKGREAVVVDYKSGELELDKYHRQVGDYMGRLKDCGFDSVSGYIWYTKTNKRVVVG